MRRVVIAAAVAMALVGAACSSTADRSSADQAGVTADPTPAATGAPPTFELRPGVEQVSVTGVDEGDAITILDDDGTDLFTLLADEFGQAHFAYVPDEYQSYQSGAGGELPTVEGSTLAPGTYQVRNDSADPVQVSDPFEVPARDDVPDTALFDQDLLARCPDADETRECFTYIETRDGTLLSAMIRLPDVNAFGPGPYPTVVEYSGYSPSRDVGDGEPGSMIAGFFGYATVGVNMRGTGCSGGVFDVFNPAQQADGYDTIETIATQPWVFNGRPGMVGLSYSGITQLYVGSTRPPSLAAITPLSVIEDPWRQQWPGGVYNNGFTKQWLAERDRQSSPTGMNWVTDRVAAGDDVCESHLDLRNQNVDFEKFGRALEFFPDGAESRRLGLLVSDIDVPVYLTSAWQDEQTGPRFGTMLDRFTGTDQERFILFNGHHPDGYSPLVLTRWFEFLEFYVAERIPEVSPLVRAAGPAVFEDAFGVPLGFEEDRFTGYDSFEEALAAYEAEPKVRVLYESGLGMPEVPGAPVPTFEVLYDEWPVPEAEKAEWFLADDEALAGEPTDDGTATYTHDPEAGNRTYTDEGASAFQQPTIEFDWQPLAEGLGLSFLTAPLEEDQILAGPGYVNLWIAPGAADTSVEVNLSEVQSDGTEFRVQSGWLRLGHQGIDEELSDEFRIERTYSEEDFVDLVPGEYIEVKVPIMPFAHPFRAGSQIRLTIETPGGNTPLWTFEAPQYGGEVTHEVAWGSARPSSLVLQRLPDVDIPPLTRPCPSLRGQVCRDFVAIANG